MSRTMSAGGRDRPCRTASSRSRRSRPRRRAPARRARGRGRARRYRASVLGCAIAGCSAAAPGRVIDALSQYRLSAPWTFTNQTIAGMMRIPNGKSQSPVHPVTGDVRPAALVHLPDLGRDDERADRADDDPDDEAEDAAQAVARVLLHLLLRLVRPVDRVDAERDDEEEDPEADPARLPQRAVLLEVVCSWRADSYRFRGRLYAQRRERAAEPLEERWPRPAVMGVLNVTPDSFSDGGRFVSPADAIAHGRRLAAEGAALVDVGRRVDAPRRRAGLRRRGAPRASCRCSRASPGSRSRSTPRRRRSRGARSSSARSS